MKKRFKKILFVIPPFNVYKSYYLPSLGISYMAAVLKENKYDVEILDGPLLGWSNQKIINYINKRDYDVVGITAMTDYRHLATEIIKGVNKKVILGGVHFSFCDKHMLTTYKNVIGVVRGEGEMTMLDICRGVSFDKIDGLSYLDEDGKLKRNKERAWLDVDKLPYPARDLLPLKKYEAKLAYEDKTKCTSILTSRGCPNNCIFCANASYWKQRFRCRKSLDVVDEIEMIVKKYGIRGFDIWDDTFTVSRKHVETICNEIIKRKLNIKFYARVRVNTVDEELLTLMKKAGCVSISYGVETGSQKILNVIKKRIKFSQVIEVARIAKKLKINACSLFMMNHPQETMKDLFDTFRFACILKYKYNAPPAFGITLAYPGTDIYYEMVAKKRIPRNFNWDKRKKVKLYYKRGKWFEFSDFFMVKFLFTLWGAYQVYFRVVDFFKSFK